MRQVLNTTVYFVFHALCATLVAGPASAAVSATYGLRFNPMLSYAAVITGTHGAQIGGERFIAGKWSLGGSLSYAATGSEPSMLMSLVTRRSDARRAADATKRVTVDGGRERAVSVLATRYHGPDDRLYATAGVGYADSEARAHVGDESRATRYRSILPEVGYGYQWIYRHGGFLSLGGATIYRAQLSETLSKRGQGGNKDLETATSSGPKVFPAMRLAIGAFFK